MIDSQFRNPTNPRKNSYMFDGILGQDKMLDPTENAFILSIGGGRTVATKVSFPKVTNYQEIISQKNIFIIAIDSSFNDVEIRNEYSNLVESILRPTGKNVHIAIISTEIPACIDKVEQAKATYGLRREGATFNYYRKYVCHMDPEKKAYNKIWIRCFINLISRINEFNCKLYIHNDAWYDIPDPFPTEYAWLKISNFGINFEVIAIIPRLLICYFNPDNLYKFQRNYELYLETKKKTNMPIEQDNVFPFFSNGAVSPLITIMRDQSVKTSVSKKKAVADSQRALGLDPENTAPEERVDPRCGEDIERAGNGGSGGSGGSGVSGGSVGVSGVYGVNIGSDGSVVNKGNGGNSKANKGGSRTRRNRSRRFQSRRRRTMR